MGKKKKKQKECEFDVGCYPELEPKYRISVDGRVDDIDEFLGVVRGDYGIRDRYAPAPKGSINERVVKLEGLIGMRTHTDDFLALEKKVSFLLRHLGIRVIHQEERVLLRPKLAWWNPRRWFCE